MRVRTSTRTQRYFQLNKVPRVQARFMALSYRSLGALSRSALIRVYRFESLVRSRYVRFILNTKSDTDFGTSTTPFEKQCFAYSIVLLAIRSA